MCRHDPIGSYTIPMKHGWFSFFKEVTVRRKNVKKNSFNNSFQHVSQSLNISVITSGGEIGDYRLYLERQLHFWNFLRILRAVF